MVALKKDEFANQIASAVGLYEASDIIHVMTDFYDDRTKVASLAPIVTMFANQNNLYAKKRLLILLLTNVRLQYVQSITKLN